MHIEYDEEGRELMRSEAEVNGETVMTEDVWFMEADVQFMADIEADNYQYEAPIEEYVA